MPSDHLLQGGRGSSHSSSELSSSEGVWQQIKWKKRKENERKGKQQKNSCPVSVYSPKKTPVTRFVLSLYSAQVSKKTIIPSTPMIHEGQNWEKKITKGKSDGSQKAKHFCTGAVRKFRPVRNFAPFCEVLDFPTFSALLSF